MRHYTTRVKQTFKKQPVIECRLKFGNGNTVLQRFSRGSMRGSRWLEGRIRKLASIGASGETILAAYGAGLKVVTRGSAYRRRVSSVLAPKRRQIVAAPLVARACVLESASEGHDDGGGNDSGGGSDSPSSDEPASPSALSLLRSAIFPSLKTDRFPFSRRPFGRLVLMSCALRCGYSR